MSKIAIISQPDQGVLIDVSGCTTLREALEHLSSTLQVSNNFWQGMHVSINLGALAVNKEELAQVLSIAKAVGITPTGVYSTSDVTRDALKQSQIPLGSGKPMTLPAVSMDPTKISSAEIEDDGKKVGPLATITMRVVDAMSRRGSKEVPATQTNELEEMKQDEFENAKPTGASNHESPFPHVAPKKRKVSLDGRKASAEKTDSDKKPVSFEPAPKSSPADKTALESEIAASTQKPDEKLFAPTVEITVPPNTVDTNVVAEIAPGIKPTASVSPAAATTQSEPISKEDQSITGPQVEVKVMSFQVTDGMMEAQPAAQAIAQAATVVGDVVTQVDADCNLDAKVGQTIVDEDDIENAEEYDIEEEFETDTLDMGLAARGGPTTLYLRQNLRSGQTVSHKGHLVIIGDINPGAEVMADGDITVWGCLRGVAHAGIGGNVNAEIRALKLQPIQIRIAHAIARAPDRPRVNYAASNGPETARMVDGKIKVVKSRLE
jgi:septum formation inhibitor MinC